MGQDQRRRGRGRGGREPPVARVLEDDFDGPWKDALARFFQPFLRLLFPHVHDAIAWDVAPEFQDKELSKLGWRGQRRGVDKLARVRWRSGEATRVLVHVEVQAQQRRDFERRMFSYFSRLFDRREEPVVSLAVLADRSPSWRPDSFSYELAGCGVRLWFPVAKLQEFEGRWEELERSDNPLAVVVMAHVKTLATQGQPQERARWKLELSRLLLRRGWSRDDILELYRFVDWLMRLPDDLQEQHDAALDKEQKEGQMPHLSSWERKKLEAGHKEGREAGHKAQARHAVLRALEVRFGHVPERVKEAVEREDDVARLDVLHERAIVAESMLAFEAKLDG